MTAAPLIARLEDAETGSRELDALVDALLFGGRSSKTFTNKTPGGSLRRSYSAGTVFLNENPEHNGGNVCTGYHRKAPTYTTSLDAALALAERVLPGDGWKMLYAGLMNWRAHTPSGLQRLPLLVCAAILKASARPDATPTHEGDERG